MEFFKIKFRPALVSIIMRAGLLRPFAHTIINGIVLDLETLIFMGGLSLEVDASGSCFMLSSVHSYWEERLSFPNVEIVVYLI